MAEWLTRVTPDLEVAGFKPRLSRYFLRQGNLLHFVSLHPGVIWVPATYCWGVTLRWTNIPSRGEYQYSQVLYANETVISSGRLGPLLVLALSMKH